MVLLRNRKRGSIDALFELLNMLFMIFYNMLPVLLLMLSIYFISLSFYPFQSRLVLGITGKMLYFNNLFYSECNNCIAGIKKKIFFYQQLDSENKRLILENINLHDSHNRYLMLKKENEHLKQLLNIAYTLPPKTVIAKIIGRSLNNHSAGRLVINAGSELGVHVHDIVTFNRALIGRIINTSKHYSEVMLILDPNSNISVVTEHSKEKAVLSVKNGNLKVKYLQTKNSIHTGEKIYTSGDSQFYPPGILIGKVKYIGFDDIFIEKEINIENTDFVMVESQEHRIVN
ncbi:rod shape-determining protein MreC [Rickettsia endosymbiont of Cardiosporidium cionae]|uniref:rod shape-determining protein MreC n=1 Tax=Rickettsia endosymbiont of Cardiosporidium cionae TaxID=2777155 RepID=UPI001895755B|nr:rod shape-determining protein MreC [Rickettsia endosymbiont of Cardiosporidium cionae]KAF8818638.1 rod shape-determining protein MreC [Rickettsia endosymbiont of Cardiosporidium cionae]